MLRTIFLIASFFMLSTFAAFSQCDTTASICGKVLSEKFISDGQQYRALLVNSEVAEFNNTFYGGSVYRIVAGSGLTAGNITFRIFDENRKLLYNSSDFGNPSYWDFKFNSTLNCTIEAQLVSNASNKMTSGCAVLLIGFKN